MLKETEKLIQIARLYYEQDLTQSEISKIFYTSRSMISRLLRQAKEEGIVEVIIHAPDERDRNIENQLKSVFQLKDAIIIDSKDLTENERLSTIAKVASTYIDSLLTEKSILGITWGNAIYKIVSELRPKRTIPSLKIVQLMGAVETHNPAIDGPDLVRRMAEIYRCSYHYLMTPLFIEDVKMKESLLKSPSIAMTRKITNDVDIILTGVGQASGDKDNMSWDIYKTQPFLNEIKKLNAVGHICGYLFDKDGKILNTDIHNKIISMDLDVYMRTKDRVAVASNTKKAGAILAALKGKLVTSLVTDALTAKLILQLNK